MKDKLPEWKSSLPFPSHWLGYLTLKVIVILAAIVIATSVYGLR